MFGAFGRRAGRDLRDVRVAGARTTAGIGERLELAAEGRGRQERRARSASATWCAIPALPKIEVDPETFAVTVDGEHATVAPLKTVSLNQKYFFS